MKQKYYRSVVCRNLMVLPVLVCLGLFGVSHTASAGVWGESMAAALEKQVEEELSMKLHGAITGAFKQAVGRVMNTQISAMIGGGNGKGPMFIANWQSFLVTDPQKQAGSYMNDFFTMTTGGRNSSSNYRAAAPEGCESGGFSGTVMSGGCVINSGDASTKVGVLNSAQQSWFAQEGIVSTAQAADSGLQNVACTGMFCPGDDMNFYKYQTDTAQATINSSTPDIDLMNYVSGPSEIFTGGSWRGFNAFFSNPANNPFGYSLIAKESYQSDLAQEQHKADIQAVAYQGFKAATGADGTVKTPGITIGQLVDKVQGFSFDSISSAQDWGQLISSGVSAAVTMAINTAVDAGLDATNNAISEATGVNLGLSSASLANVDWSDSGSGQSAEFNNGMNNFNTDAQSGLMGGSQVWGDMNFSGANVGSANISSQSTYSPLDSVSFQSTQGASSPQSSAPSSFIPDTTWTAPKTTQSTNPLWVPSSGQ